MFTEFRERGGTIVPRLCCAAAWIASSRCTAAVAPSRGARRLTVEGARWEKMKSGKSSKEEEGAGRRGAKVWRMLNSVERCCKLQSVIPKSFVLRSTTIVGRREKDMSGDKGSEAARLSMEIGLDSSASLTSGQCRRR